MAQADGKENEGWKRTRRVTGEIGFFFG